MKFFKSKWFKFILIALVLVLVVSIFSKPDDTSTNYRTVAVERGNIESAIEGSGTIKSSEARKIYSKVSSEVLEVYHKEGDKVNSGDVIAKLDSSSYNATVESQRIAIEQAKLSLNNIQKQISDLNITANSDGYVNGLTIAEGSYVTTTMQICNIMENSGFEVVIPFVYYEQNQIQVGSSATVTLIQNFSSLQGTVTKVGEMRKLSNASSQVVDVTIKVVTSGYSLDGAEAKGEVLVNGARQISSGTGKFTSINSNVVRAKSTGTVKSVNVYDGKFVKAGDVIAVLSNDDLQTSLQNAKLTLQNLNSQYDLVKDQLDNYTITSPIDGTITAQTLEVGDMVAQGTVLSTISNKDLLEFQIPVDELDVAKINYDQEVRVTVDAVDETSTNAIIGRITKIPLEGTSVSGVTEYNVTIQISGDENIRISMNANAKIITSSKKDVLLIPVDAIIKEDGITYVDILNNEGNIERRTITTGARNISYVEVVSGLDEGENVILYDVNGNSLF